ncbi:unnamed protein product [Darwinula stevensoni]|uniref:Uncharacterized protein n=1 Tax=Darwinula stevensoni TaxID=69355 RepID=A0A7R8X3D7_9CRUS|nr:unnamed protein product [Darwinula stevensoni]CAG0878609.1 unnamed protein product [Darwinula stevensoni]
MISCIGEMLFVVLIGAMDRFHEGDDVGLSCKMEHLLKSENFWDNHRRFSVHHNLIRRIAGSSTPALKDKDVPFLLNLISKYWEDLAPTLRERLTVWLKMTTEDAGLRGLQPNGSCSRRRSQGSHNLFTRIFSQLEQKTGKKFPFVLLIVVISALSPCLAFACFILLNIYCPLFWAKDPGIVRIKQPEFLTCSEDDRIVEKGMGKRPDFSALTMKRRKTLIHKKRKTKTTQFPKPSRVEAKRPLGSRPSKAKSLRQSRIGL